MKIEAGEFYRTRSGVLVGPLKANHGDIYDSGRFPFIDETSTLPQPAWTKDGSWHDFNPDQSPNDLVECTSVIVPEPVNEAPHVLSIVGTKDEVMAAFFAVPQYLQEQVLGALLDRVAGR